LLPALLAAIALASLTSGCASARLDAARVNFYNGNIERAAANLEKLPRDSTDHVLVLMERGMVHQAVGDFEESVQDWLAAIELANELDYCSVSRGSTSFAVNDRVLSYRGAPYERTLLRAFTAKSYLALGMWDDAAVEARNIIEQQENLDGFPDCPYARYLAACCLELQNDSLGAAYQYKVVSERLPELGISPTTGRFVTGTPAAKGRKSELICFILVGRAQTMGGRVRRPAAYGAPPVAEIAIDDVTLGHSHTLDNTGRLRAKTEKRRATMKAAKTATRVALKETASRLVADENELLGDLLRLLLFSLETPDTRAWETLPYWLQVARVSCPPNLTSFDVVFKTAAGAVIARHTVTAPIQQRNGIYVSFVRQL